MSEAFPVAFIPFEGVVRSQFDFQKGSFAMLQTASRPSVTPSVRPSRTQGTPDREWDPDLQDDSPFGVQGLTRETLQIVKPECINRLAVALALRGTREQIRDAAFVTRILSERPDWVDEYQVVHLIEKSLWIQGHSDLVMTLTKNPSQIPDNPPPSVIQALSRAYATHPDATVWYGVPVFGDQKNEDGLPIPVTAQEVRAELLKRMNTAVQHALRWGWLYRAMMRIACLPSRCWLRVKQAHARYRVWEEQRAAEARRRQVGQRCRLRAEIQAELDYYRSGREWTPSAEYASWSSQTLDYTGSGHSAVNNVVFVPPFLSLAVAPAIISVCTPMLLVPITVMSMDPFLFVELNGEPGKLRHIGHWYWQVKEEGTKRLHVHV